MSSNQLEPIKCKTIEDASQIISGDVERVEDYLERFRKWVNKREEPFDLRKLDLETIHIPLKVTEERTRDEFKEREKERNVRRLKDLQRSSDSEIDRRYKDLRDENMFRKRGAESIIEAKEALERHKRIGILGGPGAGKTTTEKYLGFRAANAGMEKLNSGNFSLKDITIPIFARLPRLEELIRKRKIPDSSGQREIEDFVIDLTIDASPVRMDKYLRDLIKKDIPRSSLLFLLDALDEVSRKSLGHNTHFTTLLRESLPEDALVVAASRIVGYTSSPVKINKELELVAFNQQNIDKFIKVWYRHNTEKGDKLLGQLKQRPAIHGMCQNPLLLTMLCMVNDGSDDSSLPARRVELYQKCIKELFKWGNVRLGIRVNDEDAERDYALDLLKNIAFEFFDDYVSSGTGFNIIQVQNKIREIYKDNSDYYIGIEEKLRKRYGILVKYGGEDAETFVFLHRTFWEYFVAQYISNWMDNDKEKALEFIKKRFWDPEWHESICFFAGTLEDPMPLIDTLCKENDLLSRHLFLALRCAGEVDAKALDEKGKDVINELVDKVWWICYEGENDFISDLAGEALVAYSLKIVERRLIAALRSREYEGAWRRVAKSLWKIGSPEAVQALMDVLRSREYEGAWHCVADALGEIDNPEAVPALISALRSREYEDVWKDVADALGKIGSPEAVQALISALRSREYEGAWHCVARALGKIGSPETVPALIDVLRSREY
ncbi:MAG: hypothetical protein SCARUB_04329, partial [Candidatus Scalindua rubra]